MAAKKKAPANAKPAKGKMNLNKFKKGSPQAAAFMANLRKKK